MDVLPGLEPTRDLIEEIQPVRWQIIPIDDLTSQHTKRAAIRLNALGSLFYFAKTVLGYSRFSDGLHAYICRELERESIRLVMEIPRDHFKTTVASVSAPMWWALPFTSEDEDLMCALGYGPEWIRWMQRAHFSSTRTLIASETISNARKIGVKIDGHYYQNDLFRFLFHSILPKDTARWNQDSMTHNRLDGEYHGEGTYDFIGVRGALQSRHYNRHVIDDAVGEKAINSDLVMTTTIDWVKKLPGAFDSDPLRPHALADQLFIGNRWSHRDLNSWLRENDKTLSFITHSADGGCCDMHPAGQPIFPEEFSMEKLRDIRQIEGAYNYAAQFRNNPVAPEAVRFKESWLRNYSIDVWRELDGQAQVVNWNQLSTKTRSQISGVEEEWQESQGAMPSRLKKALKHEVQAGETIEDTRCADLDRFAFMDPNHAGEEGRARNAIIVIGVWNKPPARRRIYLLDCWAKASSHEEWLEAALSTKTGHRGLVVKWRCHFLYVESEVAGQSGWKFAIRERMRRMKLDASFTLRPLKTERSANSKKNRIEAMEAIYENGLFWVPRIGCDEWKQEYCEYPNGRTIDLMDLTGYVSQVLGPGSRLVVREWVKQERERARIVMSRVGIAGY
jgi:hypothetical protein